jgi:hypothetical protein
MTPLSNTADEEEASRVVTQALHLAPNQFLKHLHKQVPTDRVKRFGNVELQKKNRLLASVHSSDEILRIEEVILNTSRLDESTMRSGN